MTTMNRRAFVTALVALVPVVAQAEEPRPNVRVGPWATRRYDAHARTFVIETHPLTHEDHANLWFNQNSYYRNLQWYRPRCVWYPAPVKPRETQLTRWYRRVYDNLWSRYGH